MPDHLLQLTDLGGGLLQGNPQREVDQISEDTQVFLHTVISKHLSSLTESQMLDAPSEPPTPEKSDSISRVGKKQAEDAAPAAFKKAPKVPPKDRNEPVQAKNLRSPPKASKTVGTADQEGPKSKAEIMLQQQLNHANGQICDLERRLQGQEASVTKAQAAAVTLLSNTVDLMGLSTA